MSSFEVRTVRSTVAAAHALPFPDPVRRAIWFFESTDEAVVLGSTQRVTVLESDELARRGLGVVRRHSGGGAVVVERDALTWFDLWLPADDPLYERDVSRSADWLGAALAEVLATLGVRGDLTVGPGAAGVGSAVERKRWGSLVCFASVGAGEVLIDGRKAVGISQRRTRAGARFQVMILHRGEPTGTAALFRLNRAEQGELAAILGDLVQPVDLDRGSVRSAIVAVFAAR